jgi:hypothetical protein
VAFTVGAVNVAPDVVGASVVNMASGVITRRGSNVNAASIGVAASISAVVPVADAGTQLRVSPLIAGGP